MWEKVENGEAIRPAAVDSTSSRNYVYVRRSITLIEAKGEEHGAHYEWDELKVPREHWEAFRQVLEHSEALGDVYEALAELAALVTEV